VANVLTAAAISFLIVPLVAWIATLGRGYMPPLAFALLVLALGNVFGKTGWAVWFPWSIIPLMIGAVGQPQTLPAGSYVVAALTFVVGVAATIAQLRWADTAQ
jgi:ABC-2 type transport system permease protein